MVAQNAVVLGGGSWGTTAAHLLSHNAETVLWARDEAAVAAMQQTGQNTRYLPGLKLHPALSVTTDLSGAIKGRQLVVVALPTRAIRQVCARIAPLIPDGVPVVSLSKGFEADSNLRITEILHQELGQDRPVGLLTGPNLCKEILSGLPASAVVAFEDRAAAVFTQKLFTTDTFRVFVNTDVVGCELAGALKNVYVIAAGIVQGAGLGDNARSAVLTRGLAELSLLANVLGARQQTLAGLAGMGDLVATCMSPQSRNSHVGRELGAGRMAKEVLSEMDQVAEGVAAAKSAHHLGVEHGISMPIADQVYAVCWQNRSVVEAVSFLLRAQLGDEHKADERPG